MRVIAGQLKGRRLHSPPGAQTRPITDLIKGALFNLLSTRIDGSRFLDLFAGSGAVGLEALSRGALSATWVECSPLALRALRKNVEELTPTHASSIVRRRVESFLAQDGPVFDIIFADPPFAADPGRFVGLVSRVLAPDGIFILRHHSKTVVPEPDGLTRRFVREYGDSHLTAFDRSSDGTEEVR